MSRSAIIAATTLALSVGGAQGQTAAQGEGGGPTTTVATLFADFLHYSVLGRFDLAEAKARELLDRPDLDPVELLRLSERQERSMETLLILIRNSSISEVAARVVAKINEGEHLLRKDADRIRDNILKLGGPPQMEYNATQRLADSGEYAVPWLIQTLRDPEQKSLWPRVIRAMPRIGKAAVNPLVEALAIGDENVRQILIHALGELGYPQAVSYLQALLSDESVSPESQAAASTAIGRIEDRGGRSLRTAAADGFVLLAERFYNSHGSVQADPRLPEANVWYWNPTNQFLDAVPVPRSIFGPVMAMRCCERALALDADQGDAIGLWLAANIRREAELGMDVESGDGTEPATADPTRPEDFPRALYFTSAAGARYAHMALQRAVQDVDTAVALGAIAGLRKVAGASSLVGSEDYKQPLVEALKFPDPVVRIRAALALAESLPRAAFRGSERVVPVLANALLQTGRKNLLVIDPDAGRLNRIADDLRDADTNVIGESTPSVGLERVGRELEGLNGIFLSASVAEPARAILVIRERYEMASIPIVVLVEPAQEGIVDEVLRRDAGVTSVEAGAGRDVLLARLEEAAERVGRSSLTPDKALAMALDAAAALKLVAADGRTPFDPAGAEQALVVTLDSAHEPLRTASVDVLALLASASAQQAIAGAALETDRLESFRKTALSGLAESARRFGNLLRQDQSDALLDVAMNESNLDLRTWASYVVGALNLSASKARETILGQRR